MTDNQRRKAAIAAFTPELQSAVREFQLLYGVRWQHEMQMFHLGRPSDYGEHLISAIRQIRNRVSSSPAVIAALLGTT